MDPWQFFGIGSLAIKRSLFLTGQVGAISGAGPGFHRESIAVPKWASFMHAFCVSGGAGGQGGFSGAAGTNRGGGGGGSCVPSASGIIPTKLLPSHVDVMVGFGGIGGTSGSQANSGSSSGIFHPTQHLNTPTALAYFRAGSGVNGALASATAAGGAGLSNAGIVAYLGTAFVNPADAVNGGAGGAHTGALGGNSGNASVIAAGSGGGAGIGTANTPFGGGVVQTVLGTNSGGTGDGGNGIDGIFMDPRSTKELFVRTGGSGGASGTTQGGRGGNGGWGCGGGGGGAGVTGGQGGSGGPGFVWIIFF